MSRPAFSGRLARRKAFDWPLFLRGFPYQPVPVWLLLSAVAGPVARAFPYAARAVCEGRLLQGLMRSEEVVYGLLVPPLAATAWYLAVGRRRLSETDHRRIADASLVLMLALSLYDAAVMGSRIREQWPVLRPGLVAIRAACWP